MSIKAIGLGAILCIASFGVEAYLSDGHEYDLKCTSDGYKLRSKHPVSRAVDGSAVLEVEVLYLGKSCDAVHHLFGDGTWCWANGGFVAEFADHRFAFPRQELSCDRPTGYETNCRCE